MDPCVLGFEQDSDSKADDDHQDPRQCAGITHVEVRKRRAVEMRWKQGCCQQCCFSQCRRTSHQNGYGGAHHALVFHFDFPPSISGALSCVPLSLSLSYTFFHNLRMDASDLFLEQIRLFTETGLLLLTKSDLFKGMCPGWNRFYGKIMLLSVRDVF